MGSELGKLLLHGAAHVRHLEAVDNLDIVPLLDNPTVDCLVDEGLLEKGGVLQGHAQAGDAVLHCDDIGLAAQALDDVHGGAAAVQRTCAGGGRLLRRALTGLLVRLDLRGCFAGGQGVALAAAMTAWMA